MHCCYIFFSQVAFLQVLQIIDLKIAVENYGKEKSE